MTAPDRRKLDYRKGSEYGGMPGLIQPPPHDPADSPSEARMMVFRMNPAAGFPEGTNADTQESPPDTKKIQ